MTESAASPVFDLDAALSRVEGDREILQEMAGLFLEHLPALVAELNQAVREQQGALLRDRAHRLKSSIANFFATRCQAATVRLEQCGRDLNWEPVPEIWQELQEALEELIPALREFHQSGRGPRPAAPGVAD